MKRAAEFCQFEKKIERFVPFQHEWPNIYIRLCRGKDALFTHILFVETGCTSKLLQGEMCQSSIDKMTRPIMKNVSVVAVAFKDITLHRNPLSMLKYQCALLIIITCLHDLFIVSYQSVVKISLKINKKSGN